MPKMTNAKSAPVLDSADDFMSKLNWQLFKAEQEQVLYGEFTGPHGWEWNPGDPIFERPRYGRAGVTSQAGVEMWTADGYIRPMIEELPTEDESFWTRCKDCEVSWKTDDPCFVCGTTYPSLTGPRNIFKQASLGVGVDFGTIDEVSTDRAHEVISRARASMMGLGGAINDDYTIRADTLMERLTAERLQRERDDISITVEFDVDYNRYRYYTEHAYNVVDFDVMLSMPQRGVDEEIRTALVEREMQARAECTDPTHRHNRRIPSYDTIVADFDPEADHIRYSVNAESFAEVGLAAVRAVTGPLRESIQRSTEAMRGVGSQLAEAMDEASRNVPDLTAVAGYAQVDALFTEALFRSNEPFQTPYLPEFASIALTDWTTVEEPSASIQLPENWEVECTTAPVPLPDMGESTVANRPNQFIWSRPVTEMRRS